jgi:TonB-linked SusC/RagA family outer membrane protein
MRWSRLLAFLVVLLLPVSATAQTATGRVTGVVTETGTGQPVADAILTLQGTALRVHSAADGRFSMPVVPVGRYLLRSARIGFGVHADSVVVVAGQTSTVNVALHRVSVTLDQVVVIGYGTQRRSDLTGSVASVTPNVDQTPVTSLEQTLQGAAPGVVVSTASSAPGGGISIRIRGGSSVGGSNEPLYIVDGFPIENGNASPTSGGRDSAVTVTPSPLATLNANDIASIEILKDASATSIYGSRGANGVVIITTKRGVSGAPKVTLDTYTGTQSIAKRYDLLNAHDFALFANAWAANQTPALAIPYPNADTITTSTDWQDLIYQNAPISSIQLGATGGTSGENITRYAISGGTLQQQGIVRGSDFKRISLRGNVSQAVGAKLQLSSNLLVSNVNSSQVPTDGSFNAGAGAVGAALQYIPVMPVRRASDGGYSLASTDCPVVLTADGINCGNIPNPVASAFDVQDRLGDTRVLAGVTGDYTLLSGLVFHTNVGADLSNRTRDTYYPRTTLQGQGVNGSAIRGTQGNTGWLTEFTLNYDKSFNASNRLQALGGYTRQTYKSVRETASNTNFVSDVTGFEDIGAGAQAGGATVGSSTTRWALASYLGRINYTLADRYLFTLTGRQDGSSRFGANNRWGFFPSGAFGWRISEEPFMQRFTAIDQLKLRVSYGLAGNPSISPYQSLTHLRSGGYSFGGNVGSAYYPSTLGNADLSWETTRQADVGLDLGLYRDRLDVTADYYAKKTTNLLLQVNLPPESGFLTAFENAGSIENKGFELGVTLQAIRGDARAGDFSWTTTVNYSTNKNKVLDLGGVNQIFASSINSDIKASGSLVQVGQPIGVFYGYKTAGIFRDSATLLAWRANTKMATGSAPGLGATNFVDVNGDGVIDANDRTIIGDPTPKFSLGWQNSISFRGFQLSGMFDGVFGGKLLNLNLYRLEGASPSGNVLAARYTDAWSVDNPEGKYAKIGSGVGFLTSDFTDELIEDGSYFRLRTVTLAREIPESLLHGLTSGARLYVTGQNLHTWTNYSGFNPDVSSLGTGNTNRGVDIGAYPLARTLIFGVNLSY